MSKTENSFWTTLTDRAFRVASWVLRRAGIPQQEREILGEEAAQETVLAILEQETGSDPAIDQRELQRVAWRTTAKILRRRQNAASSILGDEHADANPSPLDQTIRQDNFRLLAATLNPTERDLLGRLQSGNTTKKNSGKIHRTSLAGEMGLSRRALGRRLDKLGQHLRENAK